MALYSLRYSINNETTTIESDDLRGFIDTAGETKFADFRSEYLGEYEAIFEKALIR
jgi:hypothetical protein